MAIRGYNEATLSASEMFKGLNEDNTVLEKVFKLIGDKKNHLTFEDIEGAYIQIKQYPNSLSRAAIKAFDNGSTVLIFNEIKSSQVTDALPFITMKEKASNKWVTYIFMDKYITRNRDGVINIQVPILHDLLLSALISTSLKSNFQLLSSNQLLTELFMGIYSQFVTRILNREYSIAPDRTLSDTVNYWINRFFLGNIIGSSDTSTNIETLSTNHFRAIDEIRYIDMKNKYEEASISSFSDLIKLIEGASPRMSGLEFGIFVSKWIDYYYSPSFLAIEVPEYIIFMIITLLSGNNIISIAATDMVKEAKNIKKMNEELIKLI